MIEPDLDAVVEEGWRKGVEDPLLTKLKCCTQELDTWGKALRRRYKEEIKGCKKGLEELRGVEDEKAGSEFVRLQQKLANLVTQEETFWRQRSKVFWMRDGDMNSKFFHAAA